MDDMRSFCVVLGQLLSAARTRIFTAISEKEISDGESITLELYNDTKARIIKNKLPAQTRKFKHVPEVAVQRMQNELNDGYGKQA